MIGILESNRVKEVVGCLNIAGHERQWLLDVLQGCIREHCHKLDVELQA